MKIFISFCLRRVEEEAKVEVEAKIEVGLEDVFVTNIIHNS